MKFELYNDQPLPSDAIYTYKLDGVRAHFNLDKQTVTSRSGKPLYNLEDVLAYYTKHCVNYGEVVAEVFIDNWETTISAVRTQNGEQISYKDVYTISPLDERLLAASPVLEDALSLGYEGLVVHTKNCMYKMKPVETYDVPIIGIQPGKGKHEGRMGALLTPMGKVGTGFTDEQREFFTEEHIGCIIEVEAMSLTPSGAFRHPRFVRIRWDKK